MTRCDSAWRSRGARLAPTIAARWSAGERWRQGARSFELRAATSLARVWRDQGKRAEAHALLAPAYATFTEGFATGDLIEAKALLDDLR